jgi:LacI family transcriptional regulator
MARVTIRDVARRGGVSVGTVSNVLNHPELVAEETLERINKVIAEIGFIPSLAARQLRGARSPAIGLVVLNVEPFFTNVAQGVEAAASEVDHLVILCDSAGDAKREDRWLRLLEEQQVSGVLLSLARGSPSRLHNELRKRGTPIVLLEHESRRRDQCSVAVDNVEGGRLAARHLAELGHERIALVNGPRSFTQCEDRRAGFLAELRAHGLSLRAEDDVEMPEMTLTSGGAAAHRLLARKRRPTAVFLTDDLMAIGAERAIFALGLRQPDDVAVVGYDDVPFAAMAFVPLTTIRQPAYNLGFTSAQLLLEESAGGEHSHVHKVFTPELVVRESTAARP